VTNARRLGRYGIATGQPALDYERLLVRVREVAGEVAATSSLRRQAERLGIAIHERAGRASFAGSHTIVTESGLRFEAARVIVCTGGTSRRLDVPGAQWTSTHSDAFALTAAPESLLVVGGGMTGLQVASIFAAFGTRVRVFQRGPRILPDDDAEIAAEVARGLRAAGISVDEGFGTIEAFERTPRGVRMRWSKAGRRDEAEASLAVAAVGWTADSAALGLEAAGIAVDERGFVRVDERLATSQPHVFAAGDVTGRSVLVPPAIHDAYVAATNAVTASRLVRDASPVPMGGFTDPEYARVGWTEEQAAREHDVVVGRVRFDETTRTIIDGRTDGFCKLVAERRTHAILGCHVVGERAADIVQAAAIAMSGGMTVEHLARLTLAFPTYVGVLSRAAFRAAREIDPALEAPTHAAGV
jgi:dihydrolipoamide dehydrogenase